MITDLPEEKCANKNCWDKLLNGTNCGGWKAQKQQNGNWKTGYICKRCGNQSAPGTSQLRLYQQTHYYPTLEGFNTTNKTISHKRQWANLTASLAKDNNNTPNNGKMPKWEQINGTQKKRPAHD